MPADNPIYLDHNATTPLLPEVVDAMLPYLREHFGNPSSGHVFGQRTRDAIERARNQVAALLGCDADQIIFTSGGTEANNLAIRGAMAKCVRRHVVTSVIEHPATARPVDWLERHGCTVTRVPVDADGRTRVDDLAAAATEGVALVTLMHSNNETGVLQPIQEAARWAHHVGALMHTDAAQSVGKVPINVRNLDVDLLSAAGHKLYAPKGIGALYVRDRLMLEPLVLGAGHERGIRPGTENVASIVGFGTACVAALRDLSRESTRVYELRERLWAQLANAIPHIAMNGHSKDRLPNTLSVRLPGVSGSSLLDATPEVAAATGSACHAGNETPSAVLLAMGVPAADAIGSIRLSLGRTNTAEQVDQAAAALIQGWRVLRRS